MSEKMRKADVVVEMDMKGIDIILKILPSNCTSYCLYSVGQAYKNTVHGSATID